MNTDEPTGNAAADVSAEHQDADGCFEEACPDEQEISPPYCPKRVG